MVTFTPLKGDYATMAKGKRDQVILKCTECGNEYTAWQGQCSYCGAWNTIVEHKVENGIIHINYADFGAKSHKNTHI